MACLRGIKESMTRTLHSFAEDVLEDPASSLQASCHDIGDPNPDDGLDDSVSLGDGASAEHGECQVDAALEGLSRCHGSAARC